MKSESARLDRAALGDADWTSSDSASLYHVGEWGDGYFSVNEDGHVAVRPLQGSDTTIDVFEVVEQLRDRGIELPALIRFQDLLKSRVNHLNASFQEAIRDLGYGNGYEGVYPIKVNQLREVVEEIIEAGIPFSHGLECGSKSELVATLPYLADHDMLLLCNGSKDRSMMRLMLAGQRLGKRVFPILERDDEMELLLSEARRAGLTAAFGLRIRLGSRGAGLWSESGGENSKFGLSLGELVALVDRMRRDHLPTSLKLLHFHLGSQIADLENLRHAVEEAARIFAWLHSRGVGVEYFDVGGGLGVSYEVGNPQALGTINYTLDDYARAVVAAVLRVCEEAGVPHPILVSESGRAVTAHHSVLVVEAVASRRKERSLSDGENGEVHPLMHELSELASGSAPQGRSIPELSEAYDRAQRLRADVAELFREGGVSVEQKAHFDRAYWGVCSGLHMELLQNGQDDLPPALVELKHELVDHYQCNFSVFRSMVDYWAIGHRFPIMPLHRLDEMPTRRGILVDLTCDSDGKVDTFVSPQGDKHHLELHPLRPSEPYCLGLFLMGAYQDIMGDMHNLFGRVTEVHVYADENEPGNFYIEEILAGSTVEEQLGLVQYHANDLERRMGNLIQNVVKTGELRPKEGVRLLNQYRRMFRDMTYLNMYLERDVGDASPNGSEDHREMG